MDPIRRNLLASSGVLLALGGASPLLAEQATPTATRKTPGRTKTDTRDPFAQLAYQRAQQDPSYTGVKNVLDYGAVGDGVADDTAAIQAAVNDLDGPYTSQKLGTIFFPTGVYKTTAPVTFDGGSDIRFLGEGGAEVSGNFNGFLFSGTGGFNYSSHAFENLRLNNSNSTNTTSGCIRVDGVISCLVKNCTIGVGGGISFWPRSGRRRLYGR
jgi:hypothetical protein